MSSRLIKAAIVLLPFYFAQIICGQDGDWEKVGSSEDAVVLFSIKRTTQTNGLMRTWVKRELKDRTRERSIEWAKNRGESPTQYQNYAYTLSLEEFNCKKKQLRVLSTLDYDIKGAVLKSESYPNAPWRDVVPDSIGEITLEAVCLEPYVTREPVPKGSAEYEAGQQFYRQKNFVKAVSAFQQAIRINPKEASYYYNLGLSLMWLDRNTEAIVAYKKAIALKRDYTSAYSFLGSVYERMKQTEDAINAYREAVRIDPKNFFATSNLARIFEKQGRYSEQLDIYLRYVEAEPDDSLTIEYIGDLYKKMRRSTDADAAYKQGIEKVRAKINANPDDDYQYSRLASLYEALGMSVEAEQAKKKEFEVLRRQISLNLDDAYVHYKLASASMKLRLYKEAISAYKKAIALTRIDSFGGAR